MESCKSLWDNNLSAFIMGMIVFLIFLVVILIIMAIAFIFMPVARIENKVNNASAEISRTTLILDSTAKRVNEVSTQIIDLGVSLCTFFPQITNSKFCQDLCADPTKPLPWCPPTFF